MITMPGKIVHMLGVIEEEKSVGAYAIEIDVRPELFRTVTSLIREHFTTYNGDFHDLISADIYLRKLPSDISFDRAEKSSSLLKLGPDDGRTRRFIYRPKNNNMDVFLQTISESNEEPHNIPISELDQRTFAILASIFAAPLVSINKNKRRVGILFDGSTIDVENWGCLRDYLRETCVSDDLSIFLLIFTGKPGTINAMYSENINRIGVYSVGIFTRTNSYKRSVEIIHYMLSSLRLSSPRIPILLFLGAGASIEAGFPPTKDLMAEAMKRILRKPNGFDIEYEELIKEFRERIISSPRLFLDDENQENLRITFERVMTEELRHYHNIAESPSLNQLRKITDMNSPSIAQHNLSKLAGSEYRPIFMTTNYDDFIERSLGGFGPVKTFYKDDDFVEAEGYISNYLSKEDAEIPVFKFHGTIHDFDSIKASVQHMISLEPNKNMFLTNILNGNLLKNIIADFEGSTVKIVFIGYGFNDPDICSVLTSVLGSGAKLHLYAVNPNQRVNRILLGSRSMIQDDYMNSVISLPFSVFSERISTMIEERPHE